MGAGGQAVLLDGPGEGFGLDVARAGVDQHEVVRRIVQCRLAHRLEGTLGGGGGLHLQAPLAELAGEIAPVRFVGIDQQDAVTIDWRRDAGLVGRRGLAKAGREPKTAALADNAVDADLARHQRRQAVADGQAKAGAAVFTRGRAVGLGEFGEQAPERLVGNADAGVANLETQAERLIVLLDDADADADGALFGKLDGIADQVEHDLAQTRRIAFDLGRYVVGRPPAQLEALGVGALFQQPDGAFDHLAQVEVDVLELEPAGLDLGVVEDVVDDGQQRLARFDHDLGIGALLLIEVGVHQQAGHAQDAVHRRADFMAHGGQEFRLGAVGRLGGVAGLDKGTAQHAGLGDVADQPGQYGDVVLLRHDHRKAEGEAAEAAVGAGNVKGVSGTDQLVDFAGGEGLEGGTQELAVFFLDESEKFLQIDLGTHQGALDLQPEALAQRHPVVVEVPFEERLVGGLQGMAVAKALDLELVLEALGLADVAVTQQPAALGQHPATELEHGAVRPSYATRREIRAAHGRNHVVEAGKKCGPGLVCRQSSQCRALSKASRGQLESLVERRIGVGHAMLGVEQQQAVIEVVEEHRLLDAGRQGRPGGARLLQILGSSLGSGHTARPGSRVIRRRLSASRNRVGIPPQKIPPASLLAPTYPIISPMANSMATRTGASQHPIRPRKII